MNERTVKIVFTAMVRNESKIILRMLESVYKYIDYWVIQDNGSTDNTQIIIQNFFREKNIPGFLYHEPWQYPGYNRNHLLQRCLEANHGCEYILRLDADEVLEVDDDFDWEELRNGDEIYVHSVQHGTVISRPWICRTDIDWEYILSKRHELLIRKSRCSWRMYYLSNKLRQVMLPGGATSENPYKYLIDSIELEQQVIKYELRNKDHSDYPFDAYYVWYLAKSYVDFLEQTKRGKVKMFFGKEHEVEMARRGIFYFKKYIDLTISKEHQENLSQVYTAEQLHTVGCVNEMAYVAYVYIGLLYLNYIDIDEGIKFLEKSYEFDNLRNEGLIHLADYYHNIGNEKNVYRYTNLAIKNVFPRNRLRVFLLETWMYPDKSSHVWDLHSFAAYKLGYYEEAKRTCQQMIDNINLVPEFDRERIKTNYSVFCNLCT